MAEWKIEFELFCTCKVDFKNDSTSCNVRSTDCSHLTGQAQVSNNVTLNQRGLSRKKFLKVHNHFPSLGFALRNDIVEI